MGALFVIDSGVTVLDADSRAAGQARRLVRRCPCSAHTAPVVMEVAELLISELVTNALLHGRPPIIVQIRCLERDGVWVAVSDASPDLPVIRNHHDVAECGRGMALVNQLADDWGVQSADPGKQVWFQVRDVGGREPAAVDRRDQVANIPIVAADDAAAELLVARRQALDEAERALAAREATLVGLTQVVNERAALATERDGLADDYDRLADTLDDAARERDLAAVQRDVRTAHREPRLGKAGDDPGFPDRFHAAEDSDDSAGDRADAHDDRHAASQDRARAADSRHRAAADRQRALDTTNEAEPHD
jgi:anti-sigma regulatory factor (Ser/Thr protein kinase)